MNLSVRSLALACCTCVLFVSMTSTVPAADIASWRLPEPLVEVVPVKSQVKDTLTLDVGGQSWRVVLQPNPNLFAPQAAQALAQRMPQDFVVFRGRLAGQAGSWVRLSHYRGQWFGAIFDGQSLFSLEPIRTHQGDKRFSAGGIVHGVYRLEDHLWQQIIDHGGVQVPVSQVARDATHAADSGLPVTQLKAAEFAIPLTIVTDESFNERHGADTAAVVVSRLNFLDGIYAAQLGVGVTLWHLEMLAENGTLTTNDHNQLLSDFRSYMTNGDGRSIPFRGLSHLFTNRTFSSNVVGTAYMAPWILCSSSSGYGWNKNLRSDTRSALVVAHEMGHNLNAGHDNDGGSCPNEDFRGIMNASINGSEQFSDCSLDAMAPVIANASCLVTNPRFDGIFADAFEAL